MKPRAAIYLYVFLLVAALVMGIGCSKTPDDSQLTQQIQSKMNGDSGLQGKPVTVQTSSGVVTLSGTVDDDNQRMAAARYASEVQGVKQVVNNLQVGSAPQQQVASAPAPQPAEQPAAKPRTSKPRRHHAPSSDDSDVHTTVITPPQNDQMASSSPPVQAAPPPPPPSPPAPKKVTIPSGTTMAVRLVDAIDSETAQQGQSFRATLDSPLAYEGDVAVPSGYNVEGHIVDVKSAGKFAGQSLLVLQLDRISVGGKSYSIQTDEYKRQGSSRGKNTAEKVGAGAAIGAIIGGLAGGGKGAGIGAAAGGGLGGGVQAATKGQQIKLPTETVLNFTLQAPLTVTEMKEGPNAGRPRLDSPQQ
jgi:hypothetical protein